MSALDKARRVTGPLRASARERAALARSSDAPVHEVLAFELAGEIYALPLASIGEILRLPPLTEVPRAPSDVLGIISVRGGLTTVIDLRRQLRLRAAPPDKHTRILLVRSEEETLGLLVDRVLQVYRLHGDEVELAADVSSELKEHVFGIGRPKGAATRGVASPPAASSTKDSIVLILLSPGPLLARGRR